MELQTLKCRSCKKILHISNFFKNRHKKCGFDNQCKSCIKVSENYGKWLNCELCGNLFYIKHRNISNRKHLKCVSCITKIRVVKTTTLNKYVIDKGYKRNKSGSFQHRNLMEEFLGRKLNKTEIVHHIDGDKFNNTLNNLWLTNLSLHGKAHSSLEKIGFILYKQDKIGFNTETGEYFLRE